LDSDALGGEADTSEAVTPTEQEFADRLRDAGLHLERHLMVNERKRQVTALALDAAGQRVIAKWAAAGESGGIDAERAFYESQQLAEQCVQLIRSEDGLLILEYVESTTLRQWLLVHLDEGGSGRDDAEAFSDFEAVVRSYIGIFATWPGGTKFGYSQSTRTTLLSLYGKLLTSGPQDTAAKPWERKLNRLVSKFSKPALAKSSSQLRYSSEGDSRTIHADLHLNNLLVVTGSLQIKLIDWENATQGSPLVDLIYSCVMIRALLQGRSKHLQGFDHAMGGLTAEFDGPAQEAFAFYSGVFGSAIAQNRRFLAQSSVLSRGRGALGLLDKLSKQRR
jgi:hypothetical protein